MKTAAPIWSCGPARRRALVVVVLLLVVLVATGSCKKSPASPTPCEESCYATLKSCIVLVAGSSAQAGNSAPCESAYANCMAKCR